APTTTPGRRASSPIGPTPSRTATPRSPTGRAGGRGEPGVAGALPVTRSAGWRTERMTASQELAAVALRAGTLPDLPQGHFIDGGFRPAAAGGRMESFDPGRAAPFAAFARGDSDDVDAAVESARRAFETVWLDTPAV